MTGRPRAVREPLPDLDPDVVFKVTTDLQTRRGSHRRPTVAGPLMVMAVQLHWQKRPWPPRAQLAAKLRTTIDAIDAALNTAIALGDLTEVWETYPGTTQRRRGVNRIRYIVPSREMEMIVRRAEQTMICLIDRAIWRMERLNVPLLEAYNSVCGKVMEDQNGR